MVSLLIFSQEANDAGLLLLVNAARVGGHESIKMRFSATRREQLLDCIAEAARVTREGLNFEVWDHDFEECWVSVPDFALVPEKAKVRLFREERVTPATLLAPM